MTAQWLPPLGAYVDETGDRGMGPNASPIFGMAGVIVDPLGEALARDALQELRKSFNVPNSRSMSGKKDIKSHDRRLHAAKTLAEIPAEHLKVVYVACVKDTLEPAARMRQDQTTFYNYAAGLMLERLLFTASEWPNGARKVDLRFGHVRYHDHASTEEYFDLKPRLATRFPTPYGLQESLSFVHADSYEMSQVADAYGIFLKAALWPDLYGNIEGRYLRTVWHQLRSSSRCTLNRGFKSVTTSDALRGAEWWPCAC